MKNILLLIFLLPLFVFSQKVKINEYDKFIKQRRIELEPLTILSSEKANVAIAYNAIGSTYYLSLSGFGWGASTIDANNEVIFLLSNDSTVTVKSTGLQMYNVGTTYNSYKHKYYITQPHIEALSHYDIVGIRKYTLDDFMDAKVSRQHAVKIKELSSLFIQELKKAKVIHTLKFIDIANVSKHIGDSVRFCCKIFSAKYYTSSENKPTYFNVGAGSTSQLLTAVIWDEDRKNFGNAPELIYNNKDVCLSGVVELYNNKPQIVVRRREQISVRTPISLEEVSHFIGDSVTVQGTVSTVNFFSNDQKELMFLNMGTDQANQLLTVIIEDAHQSNLPEQPEKFLINKKLFVKGRITLINNTPQMIVNRKDQIGVMIEEATSSRKKIDSAATKVVNVSVVEAAAKKPKETVRMADRTAEFPGGAKGWKNFLIDNLQSPPELEPGERKTVMARFLINTDGSISKIEILQSAGENYDKEVIRVLKKMPKWIPEVRYGEPISVTYDMPITFFRY